MDRIDYGVLERAAARVRELLPNAAPEICLILGSGWNEVAEAFACRAAIDYGKIPGLGKTGVAGHVGRLLFGVHAGVPTLIFQGRRHWYEGLGWTPVAIPPYLAKTLGARMLVLTNAAGGIDREFEPGDIMLIRDHVNLIGHNPLIGPHNPIWGPRFPSQTGLYDKALSALLLREASRLGQALRQGVYAAVAGPPYETPAEIEACRSLGCHAVGMSTVPEALLAYAAGLRVAGLSLIANVAGGADGHGPSHEEVLEATSQATARIKNLLLGFWERLPDRPEGENNE